MERFQDNQTLTLSCYLCCLCWAVQRKWARGTKHDTVCAVWGERDNGEVSSGAKACDESHRVIQELPIPLKKKKKKHASRAGPHTQVPNLWNIKRPTALWTQKAETNQRYSNVLKWLRVSPSLWLSLDVLSTWCWIWVMKVTLEKGKCDLPFS